MNYPPYPLSSRIRTVIFALSTVVFLIVAPCVTLYTAGYRFNLQSLRFTKTGVLSIDIEPKDAFVYLNNTRIERNAPMWISDLMPGTYNLRLEKDNYLPWVKDIVIEKSKTTYIKNITLFSIQSPEAVETSETLHDIFPSHDGMYIVENFKTNNQNKFVLFDTKQEIATQIENNTTSSKQNIFWSDKTNTLALIETNASSTDGIILSADNPKEYSRFHIPAEAQSYQWKENFYKETLLIRSKNLLSTVATQDTIKQKTFLSTSSLFYRDADEQDWFFDERTNSLYTKKESLFLGTNKVKRVIDINKNRALVETDTGLLIAQKDEKKEIKNIEISNFFYDADRKEYIAWSAWELWTIYENGQVALLNRMSEKIQQVADLDTTGELLVLTGDKLLGFNPGYYVTHEIIAGVNIEKLTVNKQSRLIYFFGTWNGKKGLYKLKY